VTAWPRRWERILPGVVPGLDGAPQHQLPQHGSRTRKGVAALHCTALRCAARKIREIHAPLLLVLLLDVACWLLAAVIWSTDRSSCSLVSVYAMMGPAVHWRGFAYPAPRGRTRSGASLLAFPECLSIMSSVSCFLFPVSSLLPTRCSSSCQFCHPKSAFSNCPSYLILSARSTAVSQDIRF
jgi:hypothetical protein